MLHAIRYTTIHLFLLFLSVKSAGQEYIFNHLSSRDGLLSNNILSLWQTREGYLWIGTENGLQRYDGYHFANAASEDLQKPVHQILEDKDGTIWLRMGATVGIFDPTRFLFTAIPVEGDTLHYGPELFELGLDQRKNIYLLIRGKACYFTDRDKKKLSSGAMPFHLPPDRTINWFVEDTLTHRYWINTTKGLGYFNTIDKQYYSPDDNPTHHPLLTDARYSTGLTHLFIDSRRRHWIARWNEKDGKQEFYCYDEHNGKFSGDTLGLGNSGNNGYFDVYHFMEFNDTTVLVYGLNCMSMRENGRFAKFIYPYYSPYGIQFNAVNNVLEDRENILWIATDDGLYNTMAVINNNRHLSLGQDKGNASINCLMQDDQQNIWIGTWGKGLMVVDTNLLDRAAINQVFQQQRFSDHDLQLTWALHQHRQSGNIWIGYQGGKLGIYEPHIGKVTVISSPLFKKSTIRQLEEDRVGRMWLGLQNGKIFCTENENREPQNIKFHEVIQFDGFISRIKSDPTGNLWIAVAGKGIYVIDVETKAILKTYSQSGPDGKLTGNDVRDLAFMNDSLVLIAGDQLQQLNQHSGKVRAIAGSDNTPLGKVLALQTDEHRDTWISTVNGLYRYNFLSRNLIRYNQWDGLVTVLNNSYMMESGMQLTNHKLVFAGNQSLVYFDPARYRNTTIPPDVTITDFQLFNEYLPVDSLTRLNSIRLNYDQHSFTIQFASLSFTQLEKLTYQYRLTGVDEEWIGMKRVQPVKYSLLPPGEYEFQVRVKNSEGLAAVHTTRLRILIAPPFWKTYWFFSILISATIGLLYYLHHLRVQRLLQVEKVRSKLARDLHDDMGSTLSTINILSNMALQHPSPGGDAQKGFMARINESTVQMMESMDDIIWSINPLNDSMGKVLARMKQVAGHVLEPKGIDYSFEAADNIKELSFTMEWRREIFLVYKEAINNIIKYARCSNVEVRLFQQGPAFILIVADNGTGFDPESGEQPLPTRGNGLVNMHKRAAAMKGSLIVRSAPGSGTSVELRVPLT